MDILFRRATPRDLDRINQLMVDGLNESVPWSSLELRPLPSWNENPSFLTDRVSSDHHYLWVATAGDLIVGVIFAYLAPSPDLPYFHQELKLVVESLDVDRAYRHRGIATALLERAEALGREAGAASMELEVYAENGPARRLYERLGYQPIKVRMKKPVREGRS